MMVLLEHKCCRAVQTFSSFLPSLPPLLSPSSPSSLPSYFLLSPIPEAFGSSQARGRIRAAAADLCHSQGNKGSELHLQLRLQLFSNPGSLTHWASPAIKTASSWTLCWVLNPLSHSGNSFTHILSFDLPYSSTKWNYYDAHFTDEETKVQKG